MENPTLALIRSMKAQVLNPYDDSKIPFRDPADRVGNSLSNVILKSHLRPYWNLPIPKLRVVIMTVGTRCVTMMQFFNSYYLC